MVRIVSAILITAAAYIAIEYSYALLPDFPASRPPDRAARSSGPEQSAIEPVPPTASRPAIGSSTFKPGDRPWGAIDGWTISRSPDIGCFASRSFSGDVDMFIGRTKDSRDFVLALQGSLPRTEDRMLTLNFDGTRRRRPYFEVKQGMVVGRYGGDARLVEDVSRSKDVKISADNGVPVILSLAGTRATLAAIDECVGAMPSNAALRAADESILPKNRLCEDKPSNGRLLRTHGGLKGQGHKIKVRNSAQGDAIVKVRKADTGKLAFSFFVHRNEEAEVGGFPDGTYRLQFGYGGVLTETCADFTDPRASAFDDSVTFTTRTERTTNKVITHTTQFNATLYPVTGGNAPTSTIGQNDFLKD